MHLERERMAAVLLILLIASATLVDGVNDCPPWFELVNGTSDSSGYCACATEVPNIYCDQRNQASWLLRGSCIFYDAKKDTIQTSWCPFLFPKSATVNGMFLLPANVSELNSVVCGNLSREVKGPLCGRCTNETGPSVYSVGSRCVHCSPFNIFYYLLLQYLPSTVMFLLVIIFRPNVTSAPMANYVLFYNYITYTFRMNIWLYSQLHTIMTNVAMTALTLSAVWSFDALFFISPPLCIIKHMEEIYIPFLEFCAIIYPFILLMLTYGVIKLYIRNFKPVVVLWRLFGRVYVQCYRAWDPRSSMIQAFASLFFLSYAKLLYLISEAFFWNALSNSGGNVKVRILYTDPNVPYFSTKHILLMAFSVGVAVFVFLPPLLILIVYPTSLYRKISNRIQPKWRLRIKTYVEPFHGCFKDGTNGTGDYRSLSGGFFIILCILPLALYGLVIIITPNSQNYFSYIMAVLLCALAFICIRMQALQRESGQ